MDKKSNNKIKKDLRNEFINQVLDWNPEWFRDKKYQNTVPDAIDNIKMTPGLLRYKNVDEYQRVMFPQLIHEYYSTLQKDYKAILEEKKCKDFEVNIHYGASSLMQLTVSYSTRSLCCLREDKDCIHPRHGDLVEIIINRKRTFAQVKNRVVVSRMGRFDFYLELILGIPLMKIALHSCSKSTTMISITYLEICLAMVDALNCLKTFPLCKLILSPKAEDYRMPSQLKLNVSDIPTGIKPNPSQLKVISGIIEAIEQKKPKICLVQGPPGTGKSNTIVNLIASMLKRDSNIQFLVCAASNKAVDSLALQLMRIQPTLDKNIPFLLVRIGNEEKIDEAVKQISLEKLANKLRMLRKGSVDTEVNFRTQVLENSQVIMSTLTSCYTNNCMRQCFSDNPFSERLVCIIDEAAQSNELLTMVPLLLGIELLFLVGDHKQLEPVVLSQKAKRYGFNSSLFSRAEKIFKCNTISPISMLDTQYRMVKPISSWPNKYFYDNCLKDAASVNPLGICNYMLFDHNFPQNKNGHANEREAKLVMQLILFLEKRLNLQENNKITIGIITPYHEQRALLQNLINVKKDSHSKISQKPRKKTRNINNSTIKNIKVNELIESSTKMFQNLKLNENSTSDTEDVDDKKVNQIISLSPPLIDKTIEISQELLIKLRLDLKLKGEENKDIEVNTVDSFQGSERDIIIISCVRSNGLGFTNNPNRLNVSMTRAKHTLIMFGNFKAFRKNDMWSNLIQDATSRNVLVPIDDSNAESTFNKYIKVSEKVFDQCQDERSKTKTSSWKMFWE